MLIGLLAGCGDATGDASNNTSSSNKNSSGLIQIDDNVTKLSPEQMKAPKCSEINGYEDEEELNEKDIPRENFTGLVKSCSHDGSVNLIMTLKNGKIDGTFREYRHRDVDFDQPWFGLESDFVGKGTLDVGGIKFKDGVLRSWYKNGQLKRYVKVKNGEPYGTHKAWDEDGKLVKQEKYKNGVIVYNKLSDDDVVIHDLETVEEYLDAYTRLMNISTQYKIELKRINEDSKSIEEKISRMDKLENSTNHELIRKKINEVQKKIKYTFMPEEIEDADNFDDMENALNRWRSIKGFPIEQFVEDLAANCNEDMYDCDCYSNKIKKYITRIKDFAEWAAKSDAPPYKLIMSLSDCSHQNYRDPPANIQPLDLE